MLSQQVFIAGRVGTHPQVRYMDSGKAVISFRVAVYTGKDSDPLWVSVTAFDRLAEVAADVVQKGTRVVVSGRMMLDTWTDKQGASQATIKIYANEIAVSAFSGPRADDSSTLDGADEGF